MQEANSNIQHELEVIKQNGGESNFQNALRSMKHVIKTNSIFK